MRGASKVIVRCSRLAITLGVAGATCGGPSGAATIVPSVVVAPAHAWAKTTYDSSGRYDIQQTIDQSGLSLEDKYVSGVTEFDGYFADDPTHTSLADGNEWFSKDYYGSKRNVVASQTVTYEFSEKTSINAFVLWNDEFAGIGTTQLLWSADGLEYTPLKTIEPERSTFAGTGEVIPYSAQIFRFAESIEMLFFQLVIASCPGPPRKGKSKSNYYGCGIGEVAFSSVPRGPVGGNPVVPLPAALPLLGSALGFFVWMGRRRKTLN